MNLEPILSYARTSMLIANADGQVVWANTASEQLFASSVKRLKRYQVQNLLKVVDPTTRKSSTKKQSDNSNTHIQPNSPLRPLISHNQWIVGTQHPLFVDYSISLFEQQAKPKHGVNRLASHTNDANNESHANTDADDTQYLIEIWEKDRHYRISQEQQQQDQYHIARQMLRSVAHEVKNPLAGIRGASQLLQKRLSKPQTVKVGSETTNPLQNDSNKGGIGQSNHTTEHTGSAENTENKVTTYTDIIISETDRLTSLINQLLGSQQLPNFQPVNIHQPIEHVLTLIHSQYPKLNIIRDYDLSLPDVTADNNQLIQVFLNLMNNACQSMTSKQRQTHKPDFPLGHTTESDNSYQPTLSIRTRVEFQRTISSPSHSTIHKQVAKISIHDNGVGIPETLIDQIFFPLVTGRADGTGLGLALVHDIIQHHHGQIEVRSNTEDTCFTIYLPFHQSVDC